ncbi:MAG TPA: 3-oxoacid CoA-transferase subunit B [Thermotogota bacterium]|jgi:acetate CoA/acetoacetate CoA-transferase beta subunit|nr:3-oxoacid CoA-transferase subunit B [Thermotogota bacterium]NLZ14817.1 3-oxoacid CoA-transferase subunit B [Thermotogaceae bacterium]MDD8040606.1 3-oxoacid CoA-transferase subunit B [Thermotogota bacterium]MDD8054066.1 3-oxoacid CoA-transferase subunit B [Thermotogota bacterium]HNR63065.1 3-oxoacid CoA-transferase subunit B [Thermotogota bacterium]
MIAEDKAKGYIARRVAKEFKDGDVVNLGIGIPTLVANCLPPGIQIFLHSENGLLGMGPIPPEGYEHPNIRNAGSSSVSFLPGGAIFDSAVSFGLIRGGHLDATVLGALEVDEKGHLANWMVPGKMIPGMGGAMDLVTGAKRVIVAMTHVNKNGSPKIVKTCLLPLTSIRKVDLIVTEYAVFRVEDTGLVLIEYSEESSVEEIKGLTAAHFDIDPRLKTIER